MTDDVIVRREGRVGRLSLNRPQALHALTTAMCLAMTEALMAWRQDEDIDLILLDHTGPRGFCAGGDIRMLADSGASDGADARAFFFHEYRLNHLLFGYPKPVLALMDGVTMGGGVGLSAPARYRVATERTTYAMPETGIGLFPDVGGGWFLPRMPGRIGLYLALTGARIKAADCLMAGIATHVLESSACEDFKAAVLKSPADVEDILNTFGVDSGPPPLGDVRGDIDQAFGGESVEAIIVRLEGQGTDWSRAQLAILASKSPQTLKVAYRQLELGGQAASFSQNMQMEYRIGSRVVQMHDFLEGVRAVLVDKDNTPAWEPARLAGVTAEILDAIFAPLPQDMEWSPLPGLERSQA